MSFLDKVAKLFKDPTSPSKKRLIDSLKDKISALEKQLSKEEKREELIKPIPAKDIVTRDNLDKQFIDVPTTDKTTISDKIELLEKNSLIFNNVKDIPFQKLQTQTVGESYLDFINEQLADAAYYDQNHLSSNHQAVKPLSTTVEDDSSAESHAVILNELDRSNKEFIQAVDIIQNTKENIFLTGKAGTGKTTLLKHIVSTTSKQHVVLAYTGVAALNAGGNTIHSFFQMGFAPFIPNNNNPKFSSRSSILQDLGISKEKIEVIESLDLIIIDEVSMVRCDLMDAIDTILRLIRNKQMPFGGVQMVFIGDLFQLSPIAKAEEWQILSNFYDTEFFFSAKCLQSYGNSLPYHYIQLEKIYRQTDKAFVTLLNKVRLNNLNSADYQLLNSRHIKYLNNCPEGYITLATHNRMVTSVNKTKLEQLPSKLFTFNSIIEGDFKPNEYPTDSLLSLKVGSQVMLLTNKLPLYYNGSLGVITNIEMNKEFSMPDSENFDQSEKTFKVIEDVITVKLTETSEEITVTRYSWEKYRYKYNKRTKQVETLTVGTFTQFPIKLAWAISIHKSQGLTFDKAIIDTGSAFTHGQTYVALSRCRTLDGVILKTPVTPQSVITNKNVVDYTLNIERRYKSYSS